jgi:GNAT superfamily N-acetyltransferase
MSMAAVETVTRIRRGIARHGVLGAVRRGPYLHERPIWYRLDVGVDRPVRPLAEGLRLRRATVDDVPAIPEELFHVRPESALERFDVPGTELWIVEDAEAPRFACWLFGARTPVANADEGWLELPDGVVCLEDSMASPVIRGKGVAPAVWTALAADLRSRGASFMITRVDESNIPSRRAVEKAGFEEMFVMDVRRVATWWRARADDRPADPLARTLLSRLER